MEPADSLDVNESQSVSILCKWRSNPTNLSELYFTFTPYADPSNQTPIAGVVSPPFVLTKNVQFSRNAQFSIMQNGIAELSLSNLNRNQSGFYGCTTRNAFGQSTATKPLQINIQCKDDLLFKKKMKWNELSRLFRWYIVILFNYYVHCIQVLRI